MIRIEQIFSLMDENPLYKNKMVGCWTDNASNNTKCFKIKLQLNHEPMIRIQCACHIISLINKHSCDEIEDMSIFIFCKRTCTFFSSEGRRLIKFIQQQFHFSITKFKKFIEIRFVSILHRFDFWSFFTKWLKNPTNYFEIKWVN